MVKIPVICPDCLEEREIQHWKLRDMKSTRCRICHYNRAHTFRASKRMIIDGVDYNSTTMLGGPKVKHPLKAQWFGMHDRVKPSFKQAHLYHGKGVKVCRTWHRFKPFTRWAMANGWEQGLSLDRINNDRGYKPSSCRWVTVSENSRHAANGRWGNTANPCQKPTHKQERGA